MAHIADVDGTHDRSEPCAAGTLAAARKGRHRNRPIPGFGRCTSVAGRTASDATNRRGNAGPIGSRWRLPCSVSWTRFLYVTLLLLLSPEIAARILLETRAFGIQLSAAGRIERVFSNPGSAVIADYEGSGRAFVSLRSGGKTHEPSRITLEDGRLLIHFADAEARAVLEVDTMGEALRLKVDSVTGEHITVFTMADIRLPAESKAAGWGVSVAALNEFTQGFGHPGMNTSHRALVFPKLGFNRGDAAIVIAKRERMRSVLKTVVEMAPEIPKSTVGGPFALDAPEAYGSYLFAGRRVTEETVDDIIDLADRLGLNQINMHPVRYGDWEPHADHYPEGRESLKRVIDKIHAAGMLAGVHTYSEFISKSCPYVTPVPDPRLGVDAAFTLAAPLPADATTVPVVESTDTMSATTGFFVRNSATIRIGDELIVYGGVAKAPPFGFTQCKRGAYGTAISAHDKGAVVHHLRECFGLFVPDGESTLFNEVAHNLADLINDCGFDMVYLDALDGSDAVAGREWSWHYAAKFVFELFRHLERPVLAEMSTFPHHLWYVRSRAGAWDHPTRSHKAFIDIHAQANRSHDRIFLPSHLGWWSYKTYHAFTQEPTYFDDIEHLGVRCLGSNSGISIQGVSATTLRTVPALTRLAAITRRYETLRRARYFDEGILERLSQPGHEFSLKQTPNGSWTLRPSAYTRHKVTGLDNGSERWTVTNDLEPQVPFIRIQALHSVGPYSDTDDRVIATFDDPAEFADHQAVRAVKATLAPASAPVKVGGTSAVVTATNTGQPGAPSWARWNKTFDPPISLEGREAMGLWIHGDGKGEVLNLQLRSPIHMTYARGEHYVTVDFHGWKYVELVEPDAGGYGHLDWPYRSWYSVYRSTPRYDAISTLTVYVNNVPAGETVSCALSPVRGLPLVATPIVNPSLQVGGQKLVFPVTLPIGAYLEYDGKTASLFGPAGDLKDVVEPIGDSPVLKAGETTMTFGCEPAPNGLRTRAVVTVGLYGQPLENRRDTDDVHWSELSREVDLPQQIIACDGVQNRWTTVCREPGDGTSVDLEMVVHGITPPRQPYASPDALIIDSFDNPETFANTADNRYLQYVQSPSRSGVATAAGVTHDLTVEQGSKKAETASLRYTANSTRDGGWCARGRRFAESLDLSTYSHIGIWINGDGLGETLYFQLRDRTGNHFDMKTTIAFTDWRLVTFDLSTTETDIDLGAVEYLIVYYNRLPAKQTVSCLIDSMRAFRVSDTLRDVRLTAGRQTLTLPGDFRAGDILTYRGNSGACHVRRGNQRIPITPHGHPVRLRQGINHLALTADISPGATPALTVQIMKQYAKVPMTRK